MNTRSTKDGPWCWQSKTARRRIRDAFDGTNNVTTALGVYDALCEIASDEGKETFTTTHAWIQRISGVSVSTTKKHLRVFADLGLVRITTPALRAPCTYSLLSLANGEPTQANDELTLVNGTNSANKLDQNKSIIASEEHREKGVNEPREVKSNRAFTPPTAADVEAYSASIGYPIHGQDWCDSYAAKGWMIGKTPMRDWRATVRYWKANGWKPGRAASACKGASPHESEPVDYESTQRRNAF